MENIQELEQRVELASDATERVDALNDLAWELRNFNPERALLLAGEASRSSELTGYQSGLGYALRTVGWCRMQRSEYGLALSTSRQALHLFEELGDDFGASSALNTIGSVRMFTGKFDDALEAHDRALRLREKIGDVAGQASSLNNIGLVHRRRGELDKALGNCLQARDRFFESGDMAGYHSALSNLGLIYKDLGEYPLAMQSYLQTLSGMSEAEQGTVRAMAYIGIATIHELKEEYASALSYLQDAVQLYRNVVNVHGEAVALNNLGLIHTRLGNPVESERYFRQALERQIKIGNREGESLILNNLGYVYGLQGDSERALEHFERTVQIAHEIGSRPNEIQGLFNIGNLLTREGRPVDALPHLIQGHRLAEETGAGQDIANAHELLHACYKAMGEFERALEHHERYHEQTAKLFNEESDRRLRNMQAVHQVEQSRREAEAYRDKNIELAEMNRALERATMLKSNLLSVTAHDLGSPLSGIQRCVNTLLHETMLSSSVLARIQLIHRAAGDMQTLVHNLLVMAAIEEGDLIVERRTLDLARLAREVVMRNLPAAEGKGQRLVMEIKGCCPVAGDAVRLREVIDNLVNNAIKYSPRDGSISLHLSASGEVVLLVVEDQGPGLTDDDRERLFGRFQRLSARPTGGESSTGLGLWIVGQLVDLHGGSVRVESEPGHGSRFIVEFPVASSASSHFVPDEDNHARESMLIP